MNDQLLQMLSGNASPPEDPWKAMAKTILKIGGLILLCVALILLAVLAFRAGCVAIDFAIESQKNLLDSISNSGEIRSD